MFPHSLVLILRRVRKKGRQKSFMLKVWIEMVNSWKRDEKWCLKKRGLKIWTEIVNSWKRDHKIWKFKKRDL